MLALHRGQGMDIYWRCSLKCPSEEEYKDMVILSMSVYLVCYFLTYLETGGLFGMAVKLMQLFSTNTR